MKNKLLNIFTLLLVLSGLKGFGQCLTMDVELSDRVQAASLIVDGQIIAKNCFEQNGMIYTKNTLQVYQVFKGNLSGAGEIEIITLGGQIGDNGLDVTPSMQVKNGDFAFFFLQKWSKDNSYFEAVFDGMGKVNYDFYDKTASDLFHQYGDIKTAFIPMFDALFNQNERITLKTPFYEINKIDRRATPNITLLSPSTIAGGNEQVLTIDGSNFGAVQGTGKVQFEDGNDGGNSWYDAIEYKSWSDTKIEVYVPSRAGTGNIRVTNGTNEIRVSTQIITVPYSLQNATFSDENDNPYFTKLIEDNSLTKSFNWQYNTRFFDSTAAKDGFERSLEAWRCATFVPFDKQATVTNFSNYEANDGVNLVTWDHGTALPTNVLGRCYSRWSSCGSTGNRTVFVNELDIVFNINRNWHYGQNNASGGRMDFVSVCTHELGHGHQLAHVIDGTKMMHFSIGANQTKRNISAGDRDGGDKVMERSVVRTCNRDELTALNAANCAFNATQPDFLVSNDNPCLEEQITFTDNTNGLGTVWTWNFGANAVPATALGEGPHNVSYTTGGAKNVSLTVLSPTGNVIETKNNFVTVKNDKRVDTKIIFSNYGNNTFKYYAENGASLSKSWIYNNGRDSIVNIDTVYITYPSPGSYTFQLRAKNSCNDTLLTVNLTDWTNIENLSDKQIEVYPNPAKNSININTNGTEFDRVSITDLTGKTVLSEPFIANKPILLHALSKGMYMLNLHQQKQTITTKLIIE